MIPYIGGKHKQSKWMETFLPSDIKQYAEVFGGAMWFYVKNYVKPQVAYYNDLDPLMVNLFTCFKMYDDFINGIKDLPTYDQETFKKMKYIIQSNAEKEIEIPNMEFAIAHVYVIAHIFSGFTKDIWRPNLNMVKRRPSAPDFMGDHAVVSKLKNEIIRKKFDVLEISNESFSTFIPRIDNEKLFLYADPPYWKTETHYREGGFSKEDHENLVHMLKNSKCKWMLSYYDFPELQSWFPEDQYIWKRKMYMKASGAVKKGTNKNPDEEVLIMNYDKDKMEQEKLSDIFDILSNGYK